MLLQLQFAGLLMKHQKPSFKNSMAVRVAEPDQVTFKVAYLQKPQLGFSILILEQQHLELHMHKVQALVHVKTMM